MNLIQQSAPISPARLKGMKWKGERAFRILSQSFSVRWNGSVLDLTDDLLQRAFGDFSVPHPNRVRGSSSGDGESVYSLIDLGGRHPRRYRLLLHDEQLLTSQHADDVVNHLLWQILLRMRGTDEFLLIHAGSVVTPRGEGLLLPADAGSGKTTLVAGLIQAGFEFLSDEVGVIDHDTSWVQPYPRGLNFKEGALSVFPDLPLPDHISPLSQRQGYVRAEDIRQGVMGMPCEVRFVIAPRYMEGAVTKLTPFSTVETVKELWANALNREVYGARALPLLARVARRARGYRLVSGDLGEAVRAVAELTGAPDPKRGRVRRQAH